MARKTKAELAAEREEAQALQEAHDFAAYPSRLMKVLEEATSANNYELTVENSMFVLRDREYQHRPETVTLSPTHTHESQDTLDTLEWVLESKMLARAALALRLEAKQAALSKLTKEEKELLGLV